jgi:hypothetical protein
MGMACSIDGEHMNAYKVLVGNSEGSRPLRRPRHSWEDNILTCYLVTRQIICGFWIL